jgi:arginine decarboxylase, pyruvoyl-dependent
MSTVPFVGMSPTPNCYALVSGAADAETRLNAFDHALLRAGVGDTNLMRVSSILPPAATRFGKEELLLPKGGLIPIAYAVIESAKPGQVISAAVAVGIPEDESEPGVIMEHEDEAELIIVETTVRKMAEDAFAIRNRRLKEVFSVGVEHHVEKVGSVFAAVVLWYR